MRPTHFSNQCFYPTCGVFSSKTTFPGHIKLSFIISWYRGKGNKQNYSYLDFEGTLQPAASIVLFFPFIDFGQKNVAKYRESTLSYKRKRLHLTSGNGSDLLQKKLPPQDDREKKRPLVAWRGLSHRTHVSAWRGHGGHDYGNSRSVFGLRQLVQN